MSAKGAAFIRKHEGFVSKAYRDPVGIITIGTGFTNRSKTARNWFMVKRGHKIRMGDTITLAENDKLLTKALKEEYGKGVPAALGLTAPVHALDCGDSVSFNCGAGSLKWSWARLYKSGKRKASGARLRKTAVTARGRRLRGLVRRRKEEADLLVNGNYGHLKISPNRHGDPQAPRATSSSQLKQDQQMLNSLGFDCGNADGLWGRKTKAAVVALQTKHGLQIDGILGPATRAKIVRLANAKRETVAVSAVGGSSATGGVATDTMDPTMWADWALYGGVAVLVIGLAYLAWFYRDEIPKLLRKV